MRPFATFVVAVLLAMAACGGAQPAPQPVLRTAPAEDPDSIQARFERTYFKVACMANAGRDPETTIVPLRKPLDYLEGLTAEKSPKLARALEMLRREGFGGVADFRVVEARLRESPDWWNNRIDARFVDELKACR
ncbi:MAG: hypothetical protein FJ087_08160 [Deltaproteobacteria bacterium]|nr:hypothetical protein [Deltaproteobacteria bacterium]